MAVDRGDGRERVHREPYSTRNTTRRQIVSTPHHINSGHNSLTCCLFLSGCVVIDSLANSHPESLSRVRLLASQFHNSHAIPPSHHPPLYFHACDLRDLTSMHAIFDLYANPTPPPTSPTTPLPVDATATGTPSRPSRIVSAIHFAALKSVPGSIADPLSYYRVNVTGTLNLIECLEKWEARQLVFSSSCVVYGSEKDGEGITEDMCDVSKGASKGITNPCKAIISTRRLSLGHSADTEWGVTDGRTKRMCEEILADLSASDPRWLTMSLRYTNPSGAHPSGYIGEVSLSELVQHAQNVEADDDARSCRRIRPTRPT